MALPVVTYGKYNYGDYSNPRPIRYKGGLGEALAAGITSAISADKRKEKEFKAAQESALMMSMQFNSQLNQAFGKAAATNRQFLRDLKQDYGNDVKAYKLGKMSFDQYEEKMTYYQNILDESVQLAAIMKPIIESDQDVDFTMVRDNDDNKAAVMARYGVKNGKYLLQRDENGLRIILPHGKDVSGYVPKSLSAAELITNTKYITPEIKYNNLKNPLFADMLTKVGNVIKTKSNLLTSRIEADLGAKVFQLDPGKKLEIINEIKNRSDLLNIFDKTQIKYYYEDEIGDDQWTASDDQKELVKNKLAEDLYSSLLNVDINAVKYVPEPSVIDPRTGKPFSSKDQITDYNKQVSLQNKRKDFFDKNLLEIYFLPRQGYKVTEDVEYRDKDGRVKKEKIKRFSKDFLNRLQELEGVESDLRAFSVNAPIDSDFDIEEQIEIGASSQFEQEYDQGKGKVRINPSMTENEIIYAIGSSLGFSRSQIQKRIEEIRKENPAKTIYSPERLQGMTNIIEGLPTNK